MGTGSFPGVKSDWGLTLTPHPLLVPWSRKSRAIPLLPLWAVRPVQSLSTCTRVHFYFMKLRLDWTGPQTTLSEILKHVRPLFETLNHTCLATKTILCTPEHRHRFIA